ncbi:MAG TPA: 50S ribosomal protein P1 [Candidatus Pacearchaeota archaeon]|nr:50S ribosomal protein P1 [Candidatus Pacearchaeota archaeon]
MEYIYSALLLHKLGKEVSEENVKSVVKATGATVDESKVKSLVVSLKGVDIDKELESASLMAAAPAAGAAPAKETKAEAHQEEEKHESAAEGLSSLFG